MLTFDRVDFQYDSDQSSIIQELSFHIAQGEFVSLVGTSGCGKSTIFRLVNQLIRPASGKIMVDGKDISGQKHYCGYMPQQDLLFPWRNVLENVKIPMEIQRTKSKDEMEQLAVSALRTVGLAGWEKKMPKELSGGMRQRAAFARTILTGCDLLLLDEPFSALDYLTRLSMREWLHEQWEKEKKTILFITHDVEEAVYLSNRILVVEESPITHLKSMDVPIGYPRTHASMQSPEAIALKEELIQMLQKDQLRRQKYDCSGNMLDKSLEVTAYEKE